MLIFGTRGRQIKLDEGSFNCPQCGVTRSYQHKRSTVYFTLFFIPIFPVRKLGEYIECSHCKQAFDMRVLDYTPPTETELLTARVRQDMEAGMPVHMVEKRLEAEGISKEESEAVLETASRGMLKTCDSCGFSYISTVTNCANCGGKLSLS